MPNITIVLMISIFYLNTSLKLEGANWKCPTCQEEVKLGLPQRLSKEVGGLSGSRNVGRINSLCLEFITDKMTIDLNVVSPFMKCKVGRNTGSNLIITKEWSGRGWEAWRLRDRYRNHLNSQQVTTIDRYLA